MEQFIFTLHQLTEPEQVEMWPEHLLQTEKSRQQQLAAA